MNFAKYVHFLAWMTYDDIVLSGYRGEVNVGCVLAVRGNGDISGFNVRRKLLILRLMLLIMYTQYHPRIEYVISWFRDNRLNP